MKRPRPSSARASIAMFASPPWNFHCRLLAAALTMAPSAAAFSSLTCSLPAETQYLSPPRSDDGSQIAYIHHLPDDTTDRNNPHSNIGIVFYPGFMSRMRSNKGSAVYRYGVEHNLEVTLFDRHGHGESRPRYSDPLRYDGRKATVGRWVDDSLAVLDGVARCEKQILVGSSMGVWLAVRTAMHRPDRVAGILGISSAPDFTETLRRDIESNPDWSEQMKGRGYVDVPTAYDKRGFYRVYSELLEEGRSHLLLSTAGNDGDDGKKISLDPNLLIFLIHGKDDLDVPPENSERLARRFGNGSNVDVDLIDGDHRLSTPAELEFILNRLNELVGIVSSSS